MACTSRADAGPLPLSGLTVIEISQTPAAAFAAVLAADQGATVIVLEPLGGSDLRRMGPPSVQDLWWQTLARGKHSLCLDDSQAGAADLLARIARSGAMMLRDESEPSRRLAAPLHPHLQDTVLHATGSDRPDLWPYSTRSEFAMAASGLMALTGRQDGPAVAPEFPLADYTAGALALAAALAESRAARLEGRAPRALRFALHEALLRLNEWQSAIATGLGRPERRNGNRFPMNSNIGNIFRTSDDQLVTVSAATQPVAHRFLTMIGGAALASDPRFATAQERRTHMDALEHEIALWIGRHPLAEVLRMARACDVVVGPIHDAAAIATNPQVIARGNLIEVGGQIMPAPIPRFAGRAAPVPAVAPKVGEHGEAALAAIGLMAGDHGRLVQAGVIVPG